MANKRKYTDEERKQRLRESQRRYQEKNKGKIQKTFSITVTATIGQEQSELLTANGYTVSQFWHYCINLLKAGQLPPKPTDSTGTGKTSDK